MAGVLSFRAVTKSVPYQPSPGAVRILRAVAQFHYLTVEQVIRLFYKPTSITTVQARMKELTLQRYCERRPLPLSAFVRGGTGAYVYTLGPKGRAFAETEGWEVPARFRPSEIPQRIQLAHIVACSDAYIEAALLCRDHEQLTFERLVHERVLRGQAQRIDVDGRPRRVVPDGWFSVIADVSGKRFRSPVALEVDMGTERQTKFRDKVAGLLAWIDGPYEKLFGTRNVTVAVICPGKAQHSKVLCSWTEAELIARQRRRDGRLFLFTGMDPASLEPSQFFLAPAWQQPFSQEPVSLIELEAESG